MSMAWFNDRGIQTKLVAMFSAILLISAAAGFLTIMQLSQTTEKFSTSEQYATRRCTRRSSERPFSCSTRNGRTS